MKDEVKILSIVIRPCPTCGGGYYIYHTPQERKKYKKEIVVGKYECGGCHAQYNS